MVFRLRFGPSALLTTASRFFAVTGGPGIASCRTEHKAEGRPILHTAFCILHSPAAQEWYRPPPAVRPFHRLGLSLHGASRVLLRPCRFDRGTISPGGEIVNRGFSSTGGHMGPPLRCIWSVHPVGADLRVRPPLLGAHIGAPLHSGAPGRSSSWPGGPQARRGDPYPPQRKPDPTGLSAPRNGRGRRVKDAAPYRVRTICRGRCPHRPAAAAAFGGPKAFSFRAGPGVPRNGGLRIIKQNEK